MNFFPYFQSHQTDYTELVDTITLQTHPQILVSENGTTVFSSLNHIHTEIYRLYSNSK